MLAFSFAGFSDIDAIEPAFKFTHCENGQILTQLALTDSLPPELIGYVDKGVPISVEYRLELWRVRPGWFDQLAGQAKVDYRIRFDPWEKEYTVVQKIPGLVIENILYEEEEAIDLLMSSGQVAFVPDDSAGEYYLAGSIVVKTMSFSSFKEVESWLKGEVSDIKKPSLEDAPDKVGEFIFNMALKISGLKNHSGETKTSVFGLDQLPFSDTLFNK
ncbi:MAG: hypothetical protein A2W25_02305 [candidate division Zixibacteria bacterium RBG_16_53_22]|nr:MAG: hypothetical protein A2W25_02305 [candidate division Zixibacteria bacterium RBG_16_53_22]